MKPFRILLSLTIILAAMILVPQNAAATELATAKKTVQAAIDDGITTFSGKTYPLAERSRLLEGLLRRYTDPSLLSSIILGRHWKKIAPAEQASFSELFMRFLVSSYAGQLVDVPTGQIIEVGEPENSSGGRVKVPCVALPLTNTASPTPVEWEVTDDASGRPVIVNITVEGVSLIRAMQDDFGSVLRSNGGKIEPLVAALERKIAENDRLNAALPQ